MVPIEDASALEERELHLNFGLHEKGKIGPILINRTKACVVRRLTAERAPRARPTPHAVRSIAFPTVTDIAHLGVCRNLLQNLLQNWMQSWHRGKRPGLRSSQI